MFHGGPPFENREDAGRRLAARLERYRDETSRDLPGTLEQTTGTSAPWYSPSRGAGSRWGSRSRAP